MRDREGHQSRNTILEIFIVLNNAHFRGLSQKTSTYILLKEEEKEEEK